MKRIIVTVLIIICFNADATTIFVNLETGNDITGAPFKNLQPAIDAAVDGDIILVEAGKFTFGDSIRYVYLPTDFPPGSDISDTRNMAFHNDGKKLAVLGGNSVGTYFFTAPTILSGDFNEDDDPLVVGSNSENAYHVFVLDNVDDTFRFDRIEFQNGNANGVGDITISGQTIAQNQGAGLYNINATPLLIATLFSGNHADANGAGLYNHNSSPQIFNSVFNDNTSGGNGAGIYNDSTSTPQIINNTFVRNDAIGDGGGLFNQPVTPVLVSNTVFYDNTAANGTDIGGVAIDVNSTHNASDDNGGGIASGVGFVDLSATPASAVFEDILNPEIIYTATLVNGDLVLSESAGFVPLVSSPLFNAGLTSANTLYTTIDNPLIIGGELNTQLLDPFLKPRVKVCVIDIGAFEVSENIRIHVDAAALDNTGGGGSWDTALRDLQFGIDCAFENDTVVLAQGIYKPTESPDETTTDPRNRAFHINKTITVKGGFDPITGIQDLNTPSILSADFLNNDVITGSGETLQFSNNEENAYHVMVVVVEIGATSTDNFSNFENLTIQGGNANNLNGFINYSGWTISHNLAGGMFFRDTRLHLKDMIIKHNSALTAAGGIWSENSTNALTDIQFISNQITGNPGFLNGGAGFFAAIGQDSLTNVVFSGNLAETGGGMYINGSQATLFNVLFYNNHSRGNGGGLSSINTGRVRFQLKNVSFISNSSGGASQSIFKGGGGLYAEIDTDVSGVPPTIISPPPALRNTIFYGNTVTVGGVDLLIFDSNITAIPGSLDSTSTFNASDGVGAGIDTTVNFTDLSISSGLVASDIFTDSNDPDGADNKFGTADDGLVPLSTSPLVNSGDNTANPTTLDLANVPRVYQTTIDKGAYEYFVDGVFADGFE